MQRTTVDCMTGQITSEAMPPEEAAAARAVQESGQVEARMLAARRAALESSALDGPLRQKLKDATPLEPDETARVLRWLAFQLDASLTE